MCKFSSGETDIAPPNKRNKEKEHKKKKIKSSNNTNTNNIGVNLTITNINGPTENWIQNDNNADVVMGKKIQNVFQFARQHHDHFIILGNETIPPTTIEPAKPPAENKETKNDFISDSLVPNLLKTGK